MSDWQTVCATVTPKSAFLSHGFVSCQAVFHAYAYQTRLVEAQEKDRRLLLEDIIMPKFSVPTTELETRSMMEWLARLPGAELIVNAMTMCQVQFPMRCVDPDARSPAAPVACTYDSKTEHVRVEGRPGHTAIASEWLRLNLAMYRRRCEGDIVHQQAGQLRNLSPLMGGPPVPPQSVFLNVPAPAPLGVGVTECIPVVTSAATRRDSTPVKLALDMAMPDIVEVTAKLFAPWPEYVGASVDGCEVDFCRIVDGNSASARKSPAFPTTPPAAFESPPGLICETDRSDGSMDVSSPADWALGSSRQRNQSDMDSALVEMNAAIMQMMQMLQTTGTLANIGMLEKEEPSVEVAVVPTVSGCGLRPGLYK